MNPSRASLEPKSSPGGRSSAVQAGLSLACKSLVGCLFQRAEEWASVADVFVFDRLFRGMFALMEAFGSGYCLSKYSFSTDIAWLARLSRLFCNLPIKTFLSSSVLA